MSDNEQLDVLIAVYLIPDLAQQDFDAFVKLAEDKAIIDRRRRRSSRKDADGEIAGEGDRRPPGSQGRQGRGRRGPRRRALRAAAPRGDRRRRRRRADWPASSPATASQAGIGEKLDDALPPGSAGIIAIYDHATPTRSQSALANAIRSSIAQIDKASAKELKAGLKEASAGSRADAAMIELIEGLPDAVVGLEAVGEVESADYETVAAPAVKRALKQHATIRLIHVLDDRFTGYTAGGAWQDAALGLAHPRSFDRIAVVTNSDSIRRLVKLAGWSIPGELKLFANREREDALAWASEGLNAP